MVIELTSRLAKVVGRALAAGVLAAGVLTVQAAPVTTLGTWYGTDGTDGTLQGRDINGNPVPLLVESGAPNPAAVFLYDTVLKVTWYNYDPGVMSWTSANDWAGALTVGGSTNWRLPEVKPVNGSSFQYDLSLTGTTDNGYNVGAPGSLYAGSTASELAHLWHMTLGNPTRYDESGNQRSIGDWGLVNTGPFQNLQFSRYWSGTDYGPDPDNHAWFFGTGFGDQHFTSTSTFTSKSSEYYVLAVRRGDVVAAAVPEPRPLALALFGLAALWLAGRWRPPRGSGASKA